MPGMTVRLVRFFAENGLGRVGCFIIVFILAGCAPMLTAHNDEAPTQVLVKTNPPVKLAVQEMGKGDPILLIHGLGISGYTWRHIAPELAKAHHVIVIDLKGFGASEKPADGKYSVFDQAALVKTFIEQQNLRNLTVIGHSFGGGVALALTLSLADENSKRLKRLILIDSIAYRQPLPIFFRVLNTPGIGEVSMALVPPEVQITEALHIAYYDRNKIPASSVVEYSSTLYEPAAKEALKKTIEQLVPPNIDEFSKRYTTIKLPTLIIWCEKDRIIPFSYGRRLAQDIKGARLYLIQKCGHLPQEEQPEDTLGAIQEFLKEQSL